MALIDLLDRPIAYHRVFRAITGSTVAAVLLSQSVYWQQICDKKKCGDGLGWWWKDRKEWEQETGLSRSEQETARKRLVQLGILMEKRRGVPARLWYRVSIDNLEEKLQQYHKNAGFTPTRQRKHRQLGGRYSAIKKAEIPPPIPETTPSNTHKETTTQTNYEMKQYLDLVATPASRRKKAPNRYLKRVKERLMGQGGLLNTRDRLQLEWALHNKPTLGGYETNDSHHIHGCTEPQDNIALIPKTAVQHDYLPQYAHYHSKADPSGARAAEEEIRRTQELIQKLQS